MRRSSGEKAAKVKGTTGPDERALRPLWNTEARSLPFAALQTRAESSQAAVRTSVSSWLKLAESKLSLVALFDWTAFVKARELPHCASVTTFCDGAGAVFTTAFLAADFLANTFFTAAFLAGATFAAAGTAFFAAAFFSAHRFFKAATMFALPALLGVRFAFGASGVAAST